MVHNPLSPSEALRTPVGAMLALFSLLVIAYSLVIVGQVLLGVMVGVALPVGLYVSYRLFAALDSIADATQRIADAREREAEASGRLGSATRRDSAPGRDGDASRSSDRLSERER
ncbi:hypothetical protein CK500_02910 [Halorubrum salipaludis]|uniref:Uncharacterized protein n=1 Tax=Halorubrum salipaludis TaxID=2032630 RepID=A0A2A2FGB7_9EURY|nr:MULTISPECIES: hypothetical protein [Halorubrum]PAU84486.1 hypothetical protein CK500_02910 [Halorubrum salipaludis]